MLGGTSSGHFRPLSRAWDCFSSETMQNHAFAHQLPQRWADSRQQRANPRQQYGKLPHQDNLLPETLVGPNSNQPVWTCQNQISSGASGFSGSMHRQMEAFEGWRPSPGLVQFESMHPQRPGTVQQHSAVRTFLPPQLPPTPAPSRQSRHRKSHSTDSVSWSVQNVAEFRPRGQIAGVTPVVRAPSAGPDLRTISEMESVDFHDFAVFDDSADDDDDTGYNPHLSLGEIVWTAPQRAYVAMPSDFDAAEIQANNSLTAQTTQPTVSKYINQFNKHERCRNVRETVLWTAIQDDPSLKPFPRHDRFIPISQLQMLARKSAAAPSSGASSATKPHVEHIAGNASQEQSSSFVRRHSRTSSSISRTRPDSRSSQRDPLLVQSILPVSTPTPPAEVDNVQAMIDQILTQPKPDLPDLMEMIREDPAAEATPKGQRSWSRPHGHRSQKSAPSNINDQLLRIRTKNNFNVPQPSYALPLSPPPEGGPFSQPPVNSQSQYMPMSFADDGFGPGPEQVISPPLHPQQHDYFTPQPYIPIYEDQQALQHATPPKRPYSQYQEQRSSSRPASQKRHCSGSENESGPAAQHLRFAPHADTGKKTAQHGRRGGAAGVTSAAAMAAPLRSRQVTASEARAGGW